MPIAVNCHGKPRGTLGFAGVTVIDVSAGASAVSVVLPTTIGGSVVVPTTLADVAEMMVVPVATVVARPAVLMVATVGAEDAQVTVAVRFWVEPSV